MPGTGVTNTGQYHGHRRSRRSPCRWPWSRSPSSRSLLVYPFVQKHFTKGMLLGAIKG